jgi:hypothetical protein
MRPEAARDALLATPGGRRLALCAVICHRSPRALYRLGGAFGQHRLVTVLTRCGLPRPVYCLAAETHRRGLAATVSLPPIVCGRGLWHLGYVAAASAVALPQSSGAFQRVASQQEPSYRVQGGLTDGFASTTKSRCTLLPGARLGNGLRHALPKLPGKLTAIPSSVRTTFRSPCPTLLSRARQRPGGRVFALGQRLRHCANHVTHTAGTAKGERVPRWVQAQTAGGAAGFAAPQMSATSTL